MYSYFFSYYTSKLSFFPLKASQLLLSIKEGFHFYVLESLDMKFSLIRLPLLTQALKEETWKRKNFFIVFRDSTSYSSCCRFKINILAQYRWKLWSFFLCSAEAALVRNFEMCRAYVLMAFPNLLLLQLCCHSATGCILALSHCQILWALLLYSHLKLQNSKLERTFISKKFKKYKGLVYWEWIHLLIEDRNPVERYFPF